MRRSSARRGHALRPHALPSECGAQAAAALGWWRSWSRRAPLPRASRRGPARRHVGGGAQHLHTGAVALGLGVHGSSERRGTNVVSSSTRAQVPSRPSQPAADRARDGQGASRFSSSAKTSLFHRLEAPTQGRQSAACSLDELPGSVLGQDAGVQDAAVRATTTLVFFWGLGCPHCEEAKPSGSSSRNLTLHASNARRERRATRRTPRSANRERERERGRSASC